MSFDSYIIGSDGYSHIDADIGANLPYGFDLTQWVLSKGETGIQSATCTADAGPTKIGAVVVVGSKIAQQCDISTCVVNKSYKLKFGFTSSPNGLKDERTLVLDVKQR
jgi:hypothetical protein